MGSIIAKLKNGVDPITTTNFSEPILMNTGDV